MDTALLKDFWFPRPIQEILDDFENKSGRKVPETLRQKLNAAQESTEPLVYLAGPMRLKRVYDCWWREHSSPKIEALSFIVLNTVVLECALHNCGYLEFQEKQRSLVARGRFRTFGDMFMPVLELDMALIHLLTRHPKSCLVAYYPTDVVKSGTDIECFEAFRLGVATFIFLDGPQVNIRPFLRAPWARMYQQKKFRAFKTWKALFGHLASWRSS